MTRCCSARPVIRRRREFSHWCSRSALRAAVGVGLFVLVLAQAGTAAADGSVLFVDEGNPSCSDAGSGTAAQPFCTIGAAAGRVSAGQTVQVAAGSYPENVTVSTSGTSSAPIVFTVAPGASVVVSGQVSGFTISGRSWVTVNGFSVTGTSGFGILVSNSSHITLSGNHVTYSGHPVSGQTKSGIRLSNVGDSLVSGNTADHNTYAGIELNNGSTRNEVRANLTFNNARGYERAAPGIRLYSAPGNIVDANVSHHNEDSGIEAYPGSNNSLIYNNVTYNNGDHGIDNLTCTGQRIIANTAYKNVTAGINVEGGSTGARLANNVSVDNGIKSPRTHSDIRVEAGSTAGTTMDYDLVYLTVPDTILIWNSTSYSSLAAFRSATGQEAHGIQADPRWASPSTGDFHLTAGSPAIDSANSGASGQPSADIEGNSRIDDLGTQDTGAGPRTYDDRGAYEFQSGPAPDAPPNAALSVAPSSGTAPLQATADASGSTDTDATPIASYVFDFGDGSPAVGPQADPTATYTFTATGTYTVTVTVTDTGGLSSSATQQVTATGAPADAPPDAALSVAPSSGTAPLQATADASGSTDTDATPIASYVFDFGDGSPAVGPQAEATATHTFTAAGSYTVTVTVADTGGLSSTAGAEVFVTTTQANLVANPGFETDLSGWNTSGSGSNISLARAAGGHSGSWAAKLTNTGTTTSTCTLNDSPDWARPTSAGTYTGSIWVRADVAGKTLKLRVREYSGSTLVGTQTTLATLTTSWQQVTVSYTTLAPGSSTLDFNAYLASADAPPGTCFYADDVAISRG
jgi:parallel beta-helix repeat protein